MMSVEEGGNDPGGSDRERPLPPGYRVTVPYQPGFWPSAGLIVRSVREMGYR